METQRSPRPLEPDLVNTSVGKSLQMIVLYLSISVRKSYSGFAFFYLKDMSIDFRHLS